MNKGFALLEVLFSLIIIGISISLLFTSLSRDTIRNANPPESLWMKLKKGCDYQCVLNVDLP